MSNSSLSSSPARSSISTTAIAGANGPSSLPVDDFHFPADLISIQDRKDEALVVSQKELIFPREKIDTPQDLTHKVLKSDLMSALAKEVKSLDEDNWMFDGPRSRINLISKQGGFLNKNTESSKHNLPPPK